MGLCIMCIGTPIFCLHIVFSACSVFLYFVPVYMCFIIMRYLGTAQFNGAILCGIIPVFFACVYVYACGLCMYIDSSVHNGHYSM